MKGTWEDGDIEGAMKALKDESPPDAGWADRAWAGIEGRIEERPSPWTVLFRPAALRWAAVAVCLAVAFAWTFHQRRDRELDLGAYVFNLYVAHQAEDDGEFREPLLLTDGTGMTPVGYEEESTLPSVYDTMLEL